MLHKAGKHLGCMGQWPSANKTPSRGAYYLLKECFPNYFMSGGYKVSFVQ